MTRDQVRTVKAIGAGTACVLSLGIAATGHAATTPVVWCAPAHSKPCKVASRFLATYAVVLAGDTGDQALDIHCSYLKPFARRLDCSIRVFFVDGPVTRHSLFVVRRVPADQCPGESTFLVGCFAVRRLGTWCWRRKGVA